MAKRRTYGQTWWGAAWLKALSGVPDENRLGRGRAYYQSGKVFNVEFDKTTLTLSALVEGSAYAPYEVRFRFTPIEADRRSKLIAAVAGAPSLAAQIIDGELPAQLLDICNSFKINLFPSHWTDLHPDCSCPDVSPFCKHLAALFYLLLDQIDRDPFFVFLTRGIDLQEEMKKRGVDLRSIEQERPKLPFEFLKDAAKGLSAPETLSEEQALKVLRNIDFTELPDMSETLAALLPEKFRPFSKESMRSQLRVLLHRAARMTKAKSALIESDQPEEIRRALLVNTGFDDKAWGKHALVHPAAGIVAGAETACFTRGPGRARQAANSAKNPVAAPLPDAFLPLLRLPSSRCRHRLNAFKRLPRGLWRFCQQRRSRLFPSLLDATPISVPAFGGRRWCTNRKHPA